MEKLSRVSQVDNLGPPLTAPPERHAYPHVRCWTSKDGQRHKHPEFETDQGTVFDAAAQKHINEYARWILRDIRRLGLLNDKDIDTWGKVGAYGKNLAINTLEAQFHMLRLCADHWKARSILTAQCRVLQRRRNEEDGDSDKESDAEDATNHAGKKRKSRKGDRHSKNESDSDKDSDAEDATRHTGKKRRKSRKDNQSATRPQNDLQSPSVRAPSRLQSPPISTSAFLTQSESSLPSVGAVVSLCVFSCCRADTFSVSECFNGCRGRDARSHAVILFFVGDWVLVLT